MKTAVIYLASGNSKRFGYEIIKKYPNQTDVPLWFGQTDRYMQRKGRV